MNKISDCNLTIFHELHNQKKQIMILQNLQKQMNLFLSPINLKTYNLYPQLKILLGQTKIIC